MRPVFFRRLKPRVLRSQGTVEVLTISAINFKATALQSLPTHLPATQSSNDERAVPNHALSSDDRDPAANVAEVSKQFQLIRRRDAPAVADKPQAKESGVRFPQEQKPRGEMRSAKTHHLLAGLGTRTADRVKTMNCGMYGRAAVPSRVYSSNA
jgi:hypothetical protein